MKLTAALVAVALMGQPSLAATVAEAQISGIVTGEALCSLARHGAPKDVMREEFARLTKKMTDRNVLDLQAHGDVYLSVIDQVMQKCPSRALPDA